MVSREHNICKPGLDPIDCKSSWSYRGLDFLGLIKLIDRILSVTDSSSKGECVAVLATMIDWKKAFPMQDHTLGVKSFLTCGYFLFPFLLVSPSCYAAAMSISGCRTVTRGFLTVVIKDNLDSLAAFSSSKKRNVVKLKHYHQNPQFASYLQLFAAFEGCMT